MMTSMPSDLKPHEKTVPGWARRRERPERPLEGRRERKGVRFSVQRWRKGCGRR
jgi:hypothetical protein